MYQTINNDRGANTLEKGLSSLKFFASTQVFVSSFMVIISFMMMFYSSSDLVIGVPILGFVLVIILYRLKFFKNLLEAIDSFKKYSESAGKNSEKMLKLSYNFLIWMKNSKTFLVVFFCVSCLTISALILVRAFGIVVISLSAVLGLILLILAAYHAGILTFFQGLSRIFDTPVFQLAAVLIAVPFCTNLIPGLIGLLAWMISQFISVRHVDPSISPFSVWGSIGGFFGANLVAWWIVDLEAGFLIKEREEGREGSRLIVESCGAVGATSSLAGVERVRLSDGAVLNLKIMVVDVKESGFSPFGGVNFDVKAVGGIAVESVPEDVKKLVADKPLFPPEPPKEGWELLDILEQRLAEAVEIVKSSRGEFEVKVVAEAVMVARNTMYKSIHGEPVYWVSWVYKVSWKPRDEVGRGEIHVPTKSL
jgi:hypothetical protein